MELNALLGGEESGGYAFAATCRNATHSGQLYLLVRGEDGQEQPLLLAVQQVGATTIVSTRAARRRSAMR
jgi:hypothetical protein